MTQIYLASRSPRRRELLDQIQIRHRALATDVDERPRADEPPADYARRIALDKARAGWASPERALRVPVLGADTCIVRDAALLGKPSDVAEALEMLAGLAGRSHQVLSAVALTDGVREEVALCPSTVWLRALSEAERQTYCRREAVLDKAGAYAIQGLAASFITRLEGSYSGVMGLPLYETTHLLGRFGIAVLHAAPD